MRLSLGSCLDGVRMEAGRAGRRIARAPALAATVILSLAAGMASVITLSGIVDTLYFREPSGIRDADRVVSMPLGPSLAQPQRSRVHASSDTGRRTGSTLAAHGAAPDRRARSPPYSPTTEARGANHESSPGSRSTGSVSAPRLGADSPC